MKTDETINMLSDKAFLDKLFGYAYRRCNTSQDAEDLCSDIIVAILTTIRKGTEIADFYPFVWKVAHHVYADFCRKRKVYSDNVISDDFSDDIQNCVENPIDDFIDLQTEKAQLSDILKEISFLSKIYRQTMILYYLDEMKIGDIAKKLSASESTVKQRLFFARNTIRKEVNKMDSKSLSLKPIELSFVGTGNPIGNDPQMKAGRMLSQNIVYLCKNEAKTAKQLSESLGVPMPYIEEEIEIQCKGENGHYGLLRDLGGGKYISNILIAEATEYNEANAVYEKHLERYCALLRQSIEESKSSILSFPFLSQQDDVGFILWSLISNSVWGLQAKVNYLLEKEYFSDTKPVEREFTTVAIAVHENETLYQGFYGCDGVRANNLCGYSDVFFSNIYSGRIEKHFGCGHNLSTDSEIMLTLRAIGGISIDSLTESEKEIAAKAIECGYLRKNGNVIEPKILIFNEENQSKFYNLISLSDESMKTIAQDIAKEIAEYMKNHIPAHLMNEYQHYNSLIASVRLLHDTVEECINDGLLLAPEKSVCAEGTFMTVKK